MTLTHDSAAASGSNGPRKVKAYTGNGEEFTWDDVYNVLPAQVTAQDEDGNVITIDLDKSSWTYDGGKKVGEGGCPQSGTYTFEAAISAADGVLADTAKKLQIVVTFDPGDNVLDNGANTDNGLPNYGVRIMLDAEDDFVTSWNSLRSSPVFNLQATSTDGRNLVIERYRWNENTGKYFLVAYTQGGEYYYYMQGSKYDASQFDYYSPSNIWYSREFSHDEGSLSLDWTLKMGSVYHAATYSTSSAFYTKSDVLVLRDAYVDDSGFYTDTNDFRTWGYAPQAAAAPGSWRYAISGLTGSTSSITDIQINDGSSDVNPLDIADWTDGAAADGPKATSAAWMSNRSGQVRTIKLTFGESENTEVDPGELTLDDGTGLPNYGLRVVLDGADINRDNSSYWYLAFALKAATEQVGSDLVVEWYTKGNDGKYQLAKPYDSYPISYTTNTGRESSEYSVMFGYNGDYHFRLTPKDAADVPYFRFVKELYRTSNGPYVLVIRPAVIQGTGQASPSDAQWTVGFMQVIDRYRTKLTGIYSSDAAGDPLEITDWTTLDDEGYLEAYDIDVPVTAGAPRTIKLVYRETGYDNLRETWEPLYASGYVSGYNRVAGMMSPPSNTGGPDGDVLIRNDAEDYGGDETVTFKITVSVPDKPINNYWWSSGGQLGFNAFLYNYDPETESYTYSDPDATVRLPGRRYWDGTNYSNGGSYDAALSPLVCGWGVGPLDNDKSFTVQLKANQAIYIPTSYVNKMGFQVKVEVMDGSVVEVEDLLGTVEYDYPSFHLSMQCFWCRIVEGSPVLKEHEAARWLDETHLDRVDWLPADREILGAVRKRLRESRTE